MCAHKRKQPAQRKPARRQSWHSTQDTEGINVAQEPRQSARDGSQPAQAVNRRKDAAHAEYAATATGARGHTDSGRSKKRPRGAETQGTDPQQQVQPQGTAAAASDSTGLHFEGKHAVAKASKQSDAALTSEVPSEHPTRSGKRRRQQSLKAATATETPADQHPAIHQDDPQQQLHERVQAIDNISTAAAQQPPVAKRPRRASAAAAAAPVAQQSSLARSRQPKQQQHKHKQSTGEKQLASSSSTSDTNSSSSSSGNRGCSGSGSESEYQPSGDEAMKDEQDDVEPAQAEPLQGSDAELEKDAEVVHTAAAAAAAGALPEVSGMVNPQHAADDDLEAAHHHQQQQQQQGKGSGSSNPEKPCPVLDRPLTARGIAQTSLARYLQQQQQQRRQQYPTGQYRSRLGLLRNRSCHIVYNMTSGTPRNKPAPCQQQQQQQQQRDEGQSTASCGYINVSRYSEAGYYKARITMPKKARQLLGLPQDVTIAPLCETPELAARAADMGAMAILGVYSGMSLNFPLDSYTPHEQQKRSGADLQQYLQAIRGKKRKLAPAAAADRRQRLLGRRQNGGSSSGGAAAAGRELQQQRRQQQQQRKCGLCTGCLAGRLCVLTLWKRHMPQATSAAAAAPRAAAKGDQAALNALARILDLHTAALEVQLKDEHRQQIALEYPEAMQLVIPNRPAAASLAAAPTVAAAAAAAFQPLQRSLEPPTNSTAGSNEASTAAAASTQQVAAAAAAAAAALASRQLTAASTAAAAEPATGARLVHYGSLPVHQEPEVARIIKPYGPTPRPGIRVQQQLASAAVAAAAGLSCVKVDSKEPVKMACRACGSLLHLHAIKDRCPVHLNLVHSAAAAAAAGEGNAHEIGAVQGNSWVDALGHEGVHLVMSLRKLADELLSDEVRVLQERQKAKPQQGQNQQQQQQRRRTRRSQQQQQQQEQEVSKDSAPAAAAAGTADTEQQQQQQQQRPIGLDPWSFVATAVLLQEISNEVLNPTTLDS